VKLLEQENAKLTQQSWSYQKKTEGGDGGASLGDSKSVRLLRAKLKEANQQIVNLLMEKVHLKQQISRLQR
jgi:hypothetical protein